MRRTGFTIVELLIVIVVIAVLASISVVAYSGIQERAKNSQTVAAVGQWHKALEMYAVENGRYPLVAACLGSVGDYKIGLKGDGNGIGECRQDNASGGSVTVKQYFNDEIKPFMSSFPAPAMVTHSNNGGYPWYRGAYFYPAYSNSSARIDYVMAGNLASCPSINGADASVGGRTSNTTFCRIRFGPTPEPD